MPVPARRRRSSRTSSCSCRSASTSVFSRRRWQWWKAACVFVGASLALEVTQHLISTGSFDVTDLIVNTAGGVIGLVLLSAIRRRLRARTAVVMTRACLIGTAVCVLAVGLFIASPMHYGPQRDVVVTSSVAWG